MTDIPFDAKNYFLDDHPDDPDEPCQICASSVMAETIAIHAVQLEGTMGYDTGLVMFHTAAELLSMLVKSGVADREQLPELINHALDIIEERQGAEDGDIRHLPPAGRA